MTPKLPSHTQQVGHTYFKYPATSRCPAEFHLTSLEVVSKPQIAFESKAQADEKAQHTFKYVSILKRSATQLSDARWGFETTSNIYSPCLRFLEQFQIISKIPHPRDRSGQRVWVFAEGRRFNREDDNKFQNIP
jgi:hypothetical protein